MIDPCQCLPLEQSMRKPFFQRFNPFQWLSSPVVSTFQIHDHIRWRRRPKRNRREDNKINNYTLTNKNQKETLFMVKDLSGFNLVDAEATTLHSLKVKVLRHRRSRSVGTHVCVKHCNGSPVPISHCTFKQQGTQYQVLSPLCAVHHLPSVSQAGCSFVAAWPSQGRTIID